MVKCYHSFLCLVIFGKESYLFSVVFKKNWTIIEKIGMLE